ncbi:MAG: branched-chain amino acid ABC transporter permease [Acidimicrobiales bacterium]
MSVHEGPSRLNRLRDSRDFRRLGACVFGMLVLALVTGPEGIQGNPTYGVIQSWLRPRVVGFLIAAVVLWALMTFWGRLSGRIRAEVVEVADVGRRLFESRLPRFGTYLLLIVLAVLLPQILSGTWQEITVDQIGTYVLLALGLNVVVGFAGLLDLGYIAFYLIGAYSTAYWSGALPVQPPFDLNPFFIIPFAVLAAMLTGVILGTPTLRLRGDYLAIVTLGFGEIIQIVATNLQGVTGGAEGVIGIRHFSVNLFGVRYAWPVGATANLPYYYLLLGFVVVALVIFHLLEHSRVGRAWTAIREDEVAAAACGINPLKYKIMAFAIGASTSGFAGVLFASKIGFIDPTEFSVQMSILVLILVVFGGQGSLAGALVGAAFIQWGQNFLRVLNVGWYNEQDLYVYLGGLLVVMMIFRPQGVLPSRRRSREIGLAEHGIGTADAMSAGETAP